MELHTTLQVLISRTQYSLSLLNTTSQLKTATGLVSSPKCLSETSRAIKLPCLRSLWSPVKLLHSLQIVLTISTVWLEIVLQLQLTLILCSLLMVSSTVAPTPQPLLLASQPVEMFKRATFAWQTYSLLIKHNNCQFALSPQSTLRQVSPTATGTYKATTILEECWDSVRATPSSGRNKSAWIGTNGRWESSWTTWLTGHLLEFPPIKLSHKTFLPSQLAKI